MNTQKIENFKLKMEELQVLAQEILRELPEETDNIRWDYYPVTGEDTKEVSLLEVRKALSKTVKYSQLETAVRNIDRCLQANESFVRL